MALSLQPRTAREVAYQVLEQHRSAGTWVQDLLQTAFAQSSWSRPDRALITELVNGVVRRRDTLAAILAAAMPRPLSQVEPPLLTLLELGTYQLAFLDRIPPFAAVHETVELTRVIGQRRWTGVVNGVMRGLTRLLSDQWVAVPGQDAIPVAVDRFRRVDKPIFANPETEPVRFLAQAYSLPEWLVARWHARWSWSQLLSIAAAANASPVLYVRVNSQKTTTEQLLQEWRDAGVDAMPVYGLPALRVDSPGPVEQLPGYAAGWWVPQDTTAMRAALLLNPQSGQRVWDVCAAPGTKATHLAELVGDAGTVLATDIETARLDRIRENAARLGLRNLQSELVQADGRDWPPGPFDAVLLDAPCSNTGVLHRRPEARWRIQPYDLGELASLQRRLLHAALDRVRPGGKLVYSTCSIEPEENERVIEVVVGQRPDARRLESNAFVPGSEGDGGFQALLQRTPHEPHTSRVRHDSE